MRAVTAHKEVPVSFPLQEVTKEVLVLQTEGLRKEAAADLSEVAGVTEALSVVKEATALRTEELPLKEEEADLYQHQTLHSLKNSVKTFCIVRF